MPNRPVTGAEIIKMLDAGIKPVVDFDDAYESGEYAEKGMRARIIKYTELHDETVRFHFDFDEFIEINKPLETHFFYDKNRVPCLSAREYGRLKDGVSVIYAGVDCVNPEFHIAENTALFFEYKALGTNEAYIKWLEQQVRELRNQELEP